MEHLKTFGKIVEIFFIIIVVTSGVTHFFLVMSVTLTDLVFGTYNVLYLNPYMTLFSGLVVGLVSTLVVKSFLKRNEPQDESFTPLRELFLV